MSLVLQIFLISAGIILTGLIISIIFRSFALLVRLILPLLIIGGVLRLGKFLRWRFPQIPWSTIYMISSIALGILLLIWALTSATTIIKQVVSRLITIAVSFVIIQYLIGNATLQKTINRIENIIDFNEKHTNTGSSNTGQSGQEAPIPITWLSCILPRWGLIQDNFYVFAFQNRSDSSSLCDTEIRICNNWQLEWSLTQPYCYPREDGNTKKIEFIPETKTYSINPLIQPWPLPYSNANFNTQWKRVITTPPPIKVKAKTKQLPIIQETDSYILKSYCITPRGEIVKPWQFVKAYSLPFSNQFDQCLPELRLCSNGKLLGNNIYPDCTYQ